MSNREPLSLSCFSPPSKLCLIVFIVVLYIDEIIFSLPVLHLSRVKSSNNSFSFTLFLSNTDEWVPPLQNLVDESSPTRSNLSSVPVDLHTPPPHDRIIPGSPV